MAFAKLNALLGAAAAARTIPDLWQAIADALRRFTPQECANYLAAAGYDATWAENALEETLRPGLRWRELLSDGPQESRHLASNRGHDDGSFLPITLRQR